jgi:RNA polymerase sigma-70 factor (ECF subfamily)
MSDAQARFLAQLETHRGILYKVARAYGRSPADRDDLVQDIVAQLWRAFPRYDEQLRYSTWMYRIALNVAISWRRREQTRERHLVADGEAVLQFAGAPEPPADDGALELLYRCIGGYDDLNKALLMLYLDGRSHQDISDVLGITPTNVATKIGRLKDRLREDFRAAGHL